MQSLFNQFYLTKWKTKESRLNSRVGDLERTCKTFNFISLLFFFEEWEEK